MAMTFGDVVSLRMRLTDRLNNRLLVMKPGCDDSVTGFNEAWAVVSKFFDDITGELRERDK